MSGPVLTPAEWRDLVEILDRRVEQCAERADRVNGLDDAMREYWKEQEAKARALLEKIDAERPLVALEGRDAFLREYGALCERRGFAIGGCGCCDSPYLVEAPGVSAADAVAKVCP